MLNTLWGCAAFSLLLVTVGFAGGWGLRCLRRPRAARAVLICCVASALPTAALAGYLAWCWVAGQPQPKTQMLADGIEYERRVLTSPRPVVSHVVRIDLKAGHRFVVTPPVDTPRGPRSRAQTVTSAVRELDADLAVNASFFRPFRDQWFLDYAPHAGDVVEPVGTTLGDGVRYGRPAPDWPSLCVAADGRVSLGKPDDDTLHAVSGSFWLVRSGQPDVGGTHDGAYPRTAVGLNAERTVMWLVVVDGKQPRYSEGMYKHELAELMLSLGAADAINLDGGGSSTMAWRPSDDSAPQLLSRPGHTKIPRRQRPVANHLGVVFANPPPPRR